MRIDQVLHLFYCQQQVHINQYNFQKMSDTKIIVHWYVYESFGNSKLNISVSPN